MERQQSINVSQRLNIFLAPFFQENPEGRYVREQAAITVTLLLNALPDDAVLNNAQMEVIEHVIGSELNNTNRLSPRATMEILTYIQVHQRALLSAK